MLAKFAEDDRIEQMNAQKRRMRQLEHKRAVEKLIEERREQFKRERVRSRTTCFAVKSSAKSPLWKIVDVVSMMLFSIFFARKLNWRLDVKKRECKNTDDKLLRKKDNVCCKNTPPNYLDICRR